MATTLILFWNWDDLKGFILLLPTAISSSARSSSFLQPEGISLVSPHLPGWRCGEEMRAPVENCRDALCAQKWRGTHVSHKPVMITIVDVDSQAVRPHPTHVLSFSCTKCKCAASHIHNNMLSTSSPQNGNCSRLPCAIHVFACPNKKRIMQTFFSPSWSTFLFFLWILTWPSTVINDKSGVHCSLSNFFCKYTHKLISTYKTRNCLDYTLP